MCSGNCHDMRSVRRRGRRCAYKVPATPWDLMGGRVCPAASHVTHKKGTHLHRPTWVPWGGPHAWDERSALTHGIPTLR
ncbi:MAG: hypothetical protein BJ554DRAFT_3819 [Olpidium bornovanus]|uniref:Uncharacterized protein n=1 Tax=Olpidium bornovanus TaxID=278681 RepID=A0A8H8DFJ5_9FUNG|nr:MAG: hypothetical protein BJ554DRAFT_3819 [Olpidium bornovanus]